MSSRSGASEIAAPPVPPPGAGAKEEEEEEEEEDGIDVLRHSTVSGRGWGG